MAEYSDLVVSTNVVTLVAVDVVSMEVSLVRTSSTLEMAMLYSAMRLFSLVHASAETKMTYKQAYKINNLPVSLFFFPVYEVTVPMLEERLFRVSSKLARAIPSVLVASTVLMTSSRSLIFVSVEVLTASA